MKELPGSPVRPTLTVQNQFDQEPNNTHTLTSNALLSAFRRLCAWAAPAVCTMRAKTTWHVDRHRSLYVKYHCAARTPNTHTHTPITHVRWESKHPNRYGKLSRLVLRRLRAAAFRTGDVPLVHQARRYGPQYHDDAVDQVRYSSSIEFDNYMSRMQYE